MNKILNTIDKIDIFGAPISLLTNAKTSYYQSKVGGLITILVGGISFTYFLYVLILWIDNQLPPNVNFKQQTISYAEFQLTQSVIELNLQDFSGDLDPFRKQNNIITPLLYLITNTTIVDKAIPLYSSDERPFTISIDNGTIVLNHDYDGRDGRLKMTQFLLVLEACQNSTDNGYNCADENLIKDYLAKFHGLIFLTIKLNQLNHATRKLQEFKKQYYTAFELTQTVYSQVMLKQQETIIDEGILFTNYQNYKFLNNFELINQQVDPFFIPWIIRQMSQKPYNSKSYGSYLFRIDNISIIENVTLPKLGQILAQVGSIVQLIFLLKHIALLYNNLLLENELLHEIVSMYYPEMKNVKLNILNQLEFNDNLESTMKSALKCKYKKFLQRAKEKLRLNNILYEISRIQFIIQQQFGDQVLQQSHQMGAKLSNNYLDCENFKESNRLTVKPANSLDIENDYALLEPLEMLQKQPQIQN